MTAKLDGESVAWMRLELSPDGRLPGIVEIPGFADVGALLATPVLRWVWRRNLARLARRFAA